MKYWILIIFLSGCTTTSQQEATVKGCFLCWEVEVKQETKSKISLFDPISKDKNVF